MNTNDYIIDPFIYRPAAADPREIFNVIEFEDIMPGRYLVSIYGRIYDTTYNGYLKNKRVRVRSWFGDVFTLHYALFDTIDHGQVYKPIDLIVLSTFREYKPNNRIIHINGDTLDNNLYNLSYGDILDIPDKVNISNYKTTKPGVNMSRVPDEQIELVCKLLEKNIHPSLIAEKLGMRWRDVYNIKTFVIGRHISKKYTFKTNRGGIYNEEVFDKVAEELGITEFVTNTGQIDSIYVQPGTYLS